MIANRFPILQFCLFWDRGDVPKYPTNPTSAVFCGFASLYLTLHGLYQVGFAQPYILKIICSNINDVGLCIKTCRVDVGLWRSAISCVKMRQAEPPNMRCSLPVSPDIIKFVSLRHFRDKKRAGEAGGEPPRGGMADGRPLRSKWLLESMSTDREHRFSARSYSAA